MAYPATVEQYRPLSDTSQSPYSELSLDNVGVCLHEKTKVKEEWQIDRDDQDAAYRLKILKRVITTEDWDWKRIARYRDCGREFYTTCTKCEKIETRRNFCRDHLHCPTCSRIRSRSNRKKILDDIPFIEQRNRERVQTILPFISTAQKNIVRIKDFISEVADGGIPYGLKTVMSEAMVEDIASVRDTLLPVREDIDFIPIKKAFNASIKTIKRCRPSGAIEHLDRARELLVRELNYGWKHIVLTIANYGFGRQEEAIEALKDAMPRLKRSVLIKPAYFMNTNLEIGKTGNCHLHCLYFGPFVDQSNISSQWEKFTRATGHPSDVVWIEDAYTSEEGNLDEHAAVKESVKYTTKMFDISPDLMLEYGKILKGKKLFGRHGFRRKKQKRKRTPIGIRVSPDGGKDVIFDTRLNARCHDAKAEIVRYYE